MDEYDFIKSDNMPYKIKYHWMYSIIENNIDNIPNINKEISLLWDYEYMKTKNPKNINKNTLLENLEKLLETPHHVLDIKYIKATIKQVKRRGNAIKFRGYPR